MERIRAKIMIADDHVVFAEALRAFLEKEYAVVGTVADGRELIADAAKCKPDLIVVDIGMPLLNGLEAAHRIRENLPRTKFVFLTMQDNPKLAAAALELGVIGFVLKRSAGSELLKAIDHVLHGKIYVTPRLKQEDWMSMRARSRQPSKELTTRQREIVQLLAEGRAMKEIAAHLDLSERTVEFHKYHIMRAFNLKSNADLVLFAFKQGLILLDPEPVQTRKSS
jgi:DNA-binding NarL/FixJ family response regulator